MHTFDISGNLIDIRARDIYPARVSVANGIIKSIERLEAAENSQFLLPGFVDAHVHIESSLLIPSEFARMAVVHGTVGTVSDPHEIANVLGVAGVEFMIENGQQVPFNFFFGAPSCVPATPFETAGAEIGLEELEYLLKKPSILYLAEMMNWPGVLFKDPLVMAKLDLARKYDKPIDGHAPGLKGEDAFNYIKHGISTDHECFTSEEALDKLKHGMKILIREGSAAKNFEALIDLLPQHYRNMMFCSDDKHPDSLELGHLDQLVRRSLERGFDLFDVLQVACINPVEHYRLPVGTLQVGEPADFISVNSVEDFKVTGCWIKGERVAENGQSFIKPVEAGTPNKFECSPKSAPDFEVVAKNGKIPVIEVLDGELITKRLELEPKNQAGFCVSDTERDILKMSVINRYEYAAPAMAFIKNFGLQEGAIASSVGHDSHNIIVVGTNDDFIARACNLLIENSGGLAAVSSKEEKILALPVAGIMTNADGYATSKLYSEIDQMAKDMGSKLISPYMSLSFMALLVIPNLKLSDKGLFDGKAFSFVEW